MKIKEGMFLTFKNKVFDEDFKPCIRVGYVKDLKMDNGFYYANILELNNKNKIIIKRISITSDEWRESTPEEESLLSEYVMEKLI